MCTILINTVPVISPATQRHIHLHLHIHLNTITSKKFIFVSHDNCTLAVLNNNCFCFELFLRGEWRCGWLYRMGVLRSLSLTPESGCTDVGSL